MDHVKNVAIVGATGNLGSLILKSMIAAGKFNITVITRSSSTGVLPSHDSLTVKKGDYDAPEFLGGAFKDQDALVCALGFSAVGNEQIKLVEAAARAGVRYILPTEYGSDNANGILREAVTINSSKTAVRERIEELAKVYEGLCWIGMITNSWFDFCLKANAYSINPMTRKATLFDGGTALFNTTTMVTNAEAIARLLSLPRSTLDSYANQFVYVSSFLTSQNEILASVQRVAGTKPEEWEVGHMAAQDHIQEGKDMIAKGNGFGSMNVLMGLLVSDGNGNYEEKVINKELGLPEESMDEVVKAALQGTGCL